MLEVPSLSFLNYMRCLSWYILDWFLGGRKLPQWLDLLGALQFNLIVRSALQVWLPWVTWVIWFKWKNIISVIDTTFAILKWFACFLSVLKLVKWFGVLEILVLLSYLTYTCYVASFEGLFSYVDSTHPASSQDKGYGILEVVVCLPRLHNTSGMAFN